MCPCAPCTVIRALTVTDKRADWYIHRDSYDNPNIAKYYELYGLVIA